MPIIIHFEQVFQSPPFDAPHCLKTLLVSIIPKPQPPDLRLFLSTETGLTISYSLQFDDLDTALAASIKVLKKEPPSQPVQSPETVARAIHVINKEPPKP